MDTVSLISALVAVVSAIALVVIAAAEATHIILARQLLRGANTVGLMALLRAYVRGRQQLLRYFRTGVTLTTIAMTASLALVFSDGTLHWQPALLAASVTFLLVSSLRSASRILTLGRPEVVGGRLAGPVALLRVVLAPLSWLASAPLAIPLRAFGQRGTSDAIDPAEELVGALEAADEDATLIEERRMIRGVLEMSDQTVRELMTPRTDVTAVSMDATFGDVMRLVSKSGYSRIPLYEESLDRVMGVIYAKDLLAYVQNGNITPNLRDIARPPYLVPETKRANELLADMRRDHVHMAIAVDEYGGTAGIITVEDLVEEIVGAIEDEYDTAAVDVTPVSENEVIVDASLTIDELNEIFDSQVHSEDFDTVGGLIVTELGRLAVPGDEIIVPDLTAMDEDEEVALRLRVMSILGRRIKKVNVQRYAPESPGSESLSDVGERAAETH
ncbi:MAG: HlyC/CorC family transporter [Chloroflexi bacterium]|nr:HlyC/CorC family transporter [Chloroflexota bacterium]